MQDRILDETSKTLKKLLDEGIEQNNNLEYLDKLVDIQKDVYKIKRMKEDENMYGEYGRYEGRRYDAYGRDNYGDNYSRGSYGESYGKRGYDAKYRGHEYIDRIGENYGRYMYGRERYGNSEDTKRSLKYMLESMEDFAHKLREDAQSQEEVQMIRETAQRIESM